MITALERGEFHTAIHNAHPECDVIEIVHLLLIEENTCRDVSFSRMTSPRTIQSLCLFIRMNRLAVFSDEYDDRIERISRSSFSV